jgi:hypothetical protein
LIVACKRECVREKERERESTKRGEGNLMGWTVMKKVGTKLASEKLSQVREGEGGGGAEGRRKERMEVRVVPTTKKKKPLLLAELLLSSCFVFSP